MFVLYQVTVIRYYAIMNLLYLLPLNWVLEKKRNMYTLFLTTLMLLDFNNVFFTGVVLSYVNNEPFRIDVGANKKNRYPKWLCPFDFG